MTTPDAAVVVEAKPSDRARSPVDVLRLGVAAAIVGLVLLADRLFGAALVAFAAELFAGLSAIPAWIITAVVTGSRVLAIVLLAAGAVVMLRDGHWQAGLPPAIAGLAAAALAGVVQGFQHADVPAALAVDGTLDPLIEPGFPSVPGLAAICAVTTASAPWLARGWRRACWIAIAGLATTRFLATPASFDTLAAVLLGWLVGAAAVVGFGGPRRRPRGRAVVAGLAEVGLPLVRLEQASLDARGSTPYFGQAATGQRLFLKVLGDDERSADLLFRLYRRLVPRDLGDERPFSSLRRAVEHEALLALAARAHGVRTPRLVVLARAEPNGFVLVYEAIEGRSLDRLRPEEVTDALLVDVWCQVAALRAHRIAHRDLRLANVFVGDAGGAWLLDFGFSELVASDVLLATDVAELVASSALRVGADRAVTRAAAALRPPALHEALARLHPWALSGATRSGLSSDPGLLDDIRRRIEDR